MDLEWRQAVCYELSAQIPADIPLTQTINAITPVLRAIYPQQTEMPMTQLTVILVELVNHVRALAVTMDMYTAFFPKSGSEKTEYEVSRSSVQYGTVFLCTFPGLVRRYWEEQSQGWFEVLFAPAFVDLSASTF
jgi:hypothetical protein